MSTVSISIISLLGMGILIPHQRSDLQVIEKLTKFHPKMGLKLVPLRCMKGELKGLYPCAHAMEGPWYDKGRFGHMSFGDKCINGLIFGRDAHERMEHWGGIFPNAKKIDMGNNSLIETADLEDRREDLNSILRGEKVDRGICLDLFHCRELAVGRDRIMKGILNKPDPLSPEEATQHLSNVAIFAQNCEMVELQMRGISTKKSRDAAEFLKRKGLCYEELTKAREFASENIPLSIELPPWWGFEEKQKIAHLAHDIWTKGG